MPNILNILKGSGSAIQLLKSLVKPGMTASDLLDQVNAAGYNLLPSTGNLVINYLTRAVIPANANLKDLQGNVLPNLASIPQGLTKSLRNFSYLVKVTGQSQFGGHFEDRYISISTNSLITKEQAIDAANSMAQENTKSGGINGASGEVQSISQNPAGLTNLDTIIPAPAYQFVTQSGAQKQALTDNRNYLSLTASGPVTPIIFSLSGQITPDAILSSLDRFIDRYQK